METANNIRSLFLTFYRLIGPPFSIPRFHDNFFTTARKIIYASCMIQKGRLFLVAKSTSRAEPIVRGRSAGSKSELEQRLVIEPIRRCTKDAHPFSPQSLKAETAISKTGIGNRDREHGTWNGEQGIFK